MTRRRSNGKPPEAALASTSYTRIDHSSVQVDGRLIPLSLWFILVAVPGERKTSTDKEAFRVIDAWIEKATENYDQQLDDWKTKKTPKKSDNDPGPRPRMPTLMINSGTTEGIIKTLHEEWPALTVLNADAASWSAGYSMRDGRESATAATLSNLWSGANDRTTKASQDKPISLLRRRFSISLMLQPTVSDTIFGSATLAGQGFLSRCLCSFPESTIGSRFYRQQAYEPAWDRFMQTLQTLLDRPPPIDLVSGKITPTPLPLDQQAFAKWIAVHDRYEAALLDDYRDIQDLANKAAEQVLRLAGIQAVLEACDHVMQDHIVRADQLVTWYLEQLLTLTAKLVSHRPVNRPGNRGGWLV